jgi:hypothetical protein
VRQLGATWFLDEEEYVLDCIRDSESWDPFIDVGWPAGGGVWVLKLTHGEAIRRGTARINITRDMEERCRVIEQLEGTYYANPKDCPHLDLP